jgi:hypothetical protein
MEQKPVEPRVGTEAADSGAGDSKPSVPKHEYTPAVTLPEYLGRAVDYFWYLQPRRS